MLFTATNGTDTVTCGPELVTANPTSCTFSELIDETWNVTAEQSLSTFSSPVSNTVITVIDRRAIGSYEFSSTPHRTPGVDSTDLITNDDTPTIDLTGLEIGAKVIVTGVEAGFCGCDL